MKYCMNCGIELPEYTERFCPSCGTCLGADERRPVDDGAFAASSPRMTDAASSSPPVRSRAHSTSRRRSSSSGPRFSRLVLMVLIGLLVVGGIVAGVFLLLGAEPGRTASTNGNIVGVWNSVHRDPSKPGGWTMTFNLDGTWGTLWGGSEYVGKYQIEGGVLHITEMQKADGSSEYEGDQTLWNFYYSFDEEGRVLQLGDVRYVGENSSPDSWNAFISSGVPPAEAEALAAKKIDEALTKPPTTDAADEAAARQLVGTWRRENSFDGDLLVLNSDGSFVQNLGVDSYWVGNYTVAGDFVYETDIVVYWYYGTPEQRDKGGWDYPVLPAEFRLENGGRTLILRGHEYTKTTD
jgi:hypothetical protein